AGMVGAGTEARHILKVGHFHGNATAVVLAITQTTRSTYAPAMSATFLSDCAHMSVACSHLDNVLKLGNAFREAAIGRHTSVPLFQPTGPPAPHVTTMADGTATISTATNLHRFDRRRDSHRACAIATVGAQLAVSTL